jgi:hypothetical protein
MFHIVLYRILFASKAMNKLDIYIYIYIDYTALVCISICPPFSGSCMLHAPVLRYLFSKLLV